MKSLLFKFSVVCILLANCDSIGNDDVIEKQCPLLSASMPVEASPSVSAVLLECPKINAYRSNSSLNTNQQLCEQQLMVNIRVNPSFHVDKIEKFLILDEVFDPRRQTKAKIMSPYLIEIRRGEPVMMYPLEFAKSVKCNQCHPQDTSNKDVQNENCKQTFYPSNTKGNGIDLSPEQGSVQRAVAEHISDAPTTNTFAAKKSPRTKYNDNKGKLCVSRNRNILDKTSKKLQFANKGKHAFKKSGNHAYPVKSDNKIKLIPKISVPSSALQEVHKTNLNADDTFLNGRVNRNLIHRTKQNPELNVQPFNPSKEIIHRFNPALEWNPMGGLQTQMSNIKSVLPKGDPNDISISSKMHKLKTVISEESYPQKHIHRSLMNRKKYNRAKKRPKGKTKLDFVRSHQYLNYTGTNYFENFANNFENCPNKQGQLSKLNNAISRNGRDWYDRTLEGIKMSGSLKSEVNKRSDDKLENHLPSNKINLAEPSLEDSMLRGNYKENPSSSVRKNWYTKDTHMENNAVKSVDKKEKFKNNQNSNNIFNKNIINTASNNFAANKVINSKNDFRYSDIKPHHVYQKDYFDRISNDLKFNQVFLDEMEKNKYLKEGINNDKSNLKAKPLDEHHVVNDKPAIYDSFSLLPTFGIGLLQEKGNNYGTTKRTQPDMELEPLWFQPDVAIPEPFDNVDITPIDSSAISTSKSNPSLQSLSPELELSSPNQPAYSKIFEDTNLNINDKLKLMDVLDHYNHNSDKNNNMELQGVSLSPFLIPSSTVKDFSKKIKKRFALYDDHVETQDACNNNIEYIDEENARSGIQRHVDEDIQPCASCGGKGKKPHGKSDSSGYTPLNHCNCINDRGSCTCEPEKITRSISDNWYSVFNMSAPLPFLTTKIQIYRKRRNTWWKIAPSITLNSLSGIFANANLSILFSSHVDIFQLEKSLRIQNHQLLIPKDNRPIRQNQILMSNNNRSGNKKTKLRRNLRRSQVTSHRQYDNTSACRESFHGFHNLESKKRNTRSYTDNGIYNIADLGYFPTTMNILEQCPNDKNRLCLNMLDDRVPAYTIKVKMPFRENAIFHSNVFKVKIVGISSDATTKDALQVSIDVINEGLMAQEFSIGVYNCPMTCAGAKTTVQKVLLPHIMETITYLLPLIMESSPKHTKFECDVKVKTVILNDHRKYLNNEKQKNKTSLNFNTTADMRKIVANRKFLVDPERRCFCIWECNCHCTPKLETHLDFNVCQKLAYKDELRSGLLLQSQSGEHFEDFFFSDDKENHTNALNENSGFSTFLQNAIILLIFMLLLGLCKALLGYFCNKHVEFWGYDYIRPYKGYDRSSKCRRFFMNIFFFIVFPFLFWCKCFVPSDEDLLVASTEWHCTSLIQKSGLSSFDDEFRPDQFGENSDDEEIILTQNIDRSIPHTKFGDRLAGGQDILLMNSRTRDLTSVVFERVLNEEDDDDDEEANTKYILQALAESRENLKNLLRIHSSKEITKIDADADKLKDAFQLVQVLKDAQLVYRLFQQPHGNIRNIPLDRNYCVQGYFLPSLGEGYEFVTNSPLAQHRCLSYDGSTMEILHPPVMLCPQDFSRIYSNKLDVFEAGDLFAYPPSNAPCINISNKEGLASSVLKYAEENDLIFSQREAVLPKSKEDGALSLMHIEHSFSSERDKHENPNTEFCDGCSTINK